MPCRNHRIGHPFFDKIYGPTDRGILFFANAFETIFPHLHDLRSVVVGDAGLQALDVMDTQFLANPLLVSDKNNRDIGKVAQGLNSANNGILRGKIPPHCIKSNFHSGKKNPAKLFSANRKNLALVIVPTSWAGDVPRLSRAALWAFAQLRCFPAVGGLACAQAHLRCFAFGNSHKIYCFFVFNFSNASHADACSGTESRLALGKPLHEARHFGPPLLSHLGCAGRVR